MNKRNPTLYRATLTGFKTHAFGIEQTFDWTPEIEIYQARVSPEMWRARPNFKRHEHTWEASSAEALMELITKDFVGTIKPWRPFSAGGAAIMRPSLVPSAKTEDSKTGS
jgi:hypothetical protein